MQETLSQNKTKPRRVFALKQYLRYLARARDEYSLHSPFMFDFFTQGLKCKEDKRLLKELLKADKQLFGNAKRGFFASKKRELSLLLRSATYFKPQNVVVFGFKNSLFAFGVAKTLSQSRVCLVCKYEEEKEKAQKAFLRLQAENLFFACQESNSHFSLTQNGMQKVDLVVFDSASSNQETMLEFETVLPLCNKEAVLVFPNNNLNAENNLLWQRIESDSRIKTCADFFFCGLVFLTEKPQRKQNYILRRR